MSESEKKMKTYEYTVTSTKGPKFRKHFTWIPSEKIYMYEDGIYFRDTELFSVEDELTQIGIPLRNLLIVKTESFILETTLNRIEKLFEKWQESKKVYELEKEKYEKITGRTFISET